MVEFIKGCLPDFLKIDFSNMEVGDRFSFPLEEIFGSSGIKKIILNAKKSGVDLAVFERDGHVIFWCEFVEPKFCFPKHASEILSILSAYGPMTIKEIGLKTNIPKYAISSSIRFLLGTEAVEISDLTKTKQVGRPTRIYKIRS